ncbi:MAG: ribose-5-phosphate isomerase RpiA [Actinomycetota bacterium]|nr:ribose-5-phosphate isomerase RpiA [Actinomycetota bacterium]
MNAEAQKRAAALAALEFVAPDQIVGIGTGSTAGHFITVLAEEGPPVAGAVASSVATARLLEVRGIRVLGLNDVGVLDIYVDGADEADHELRLVKGGGGALAREKVVAAAAKRFVCIIHEAKLVDRLGAFPLAVEVLEMATGHVARTLESLGGRARRRDAFLTDNGNPVLDVAGLDFGDPEGLETTLDGIAGVVASGLFARRRADTLLVGTAGGVVRLPKGTPAQ